MPKDSVPDLLSRATHLLEAQFAALPAYEPASESAADPEAMERVLEDVAQRLGDNYPYFHPLYAGQMMKPPHPVARAAYALAMTVNPNNHARDGGRASSEMEIEAVREIASLFGWSEFLGHLTSGGTLANLEALWVAGQLAPGKRIVGSEQAHYTHQRISGVLKLDYTSIPADGHGRMSLEALETELRKGDVGTVVVTLGSTAMGSVDPLDGVLALRQRYGFRVRRGAPIWSRIRPIRLPSIRTSTDCSPSAAAASSFAILRWAAFTSTIRRTPTSHQNNCIWARSAWSVRGPGRLRWLCGPPSSFYR
jgi:hypothetical protein